MRLADFHYDLPGDLVARHPLPERDASRLLVLRRETGAIEHRRFLDLPALLEPGDLLVLNDTKVVPARFTSRRASGRRVEGLVVRDDGEEAEALLHTGGRVREGEALLLPDGRRLVAARRLGGGRWRIRAGEGTVRGLLDAVGEPPIPPYLHRPPVPEDRERYQTIYAAREGAVAAPTAGLHFTDRTFRALDARWLARATVTLHVGLGTFKPIESEEIEGHRMEAEHAIVPPAAIEALRACRARGGRVIPVGTTSVRALESLPDPLPQAFAGWTELFIRPGFRFRWADALLTNFHLPGTTLLVLVSALAGRERVLAAYREAVRERYRFLSYGDAMLIL